MDHAHGTTGPRTTPTAPFLQLALEAILGVFKEIVDIFREILVREILLWICEGVGLSAPPGPLSQIAHE